MAILRLPWALFLLSPVLAQRQEAASSARQSQEGVTEQATRGTVRPSTAGISGTRGVADRVSTTAGTQGRADAQTRAVTVTVAPNRGSRELPTVSRQQSNEQVRSVTRAVSLGPTTSRAPRVSTTDDAGANRTDDDDSDANSTASLRAATRRRSGESRRRGTLNGLPQEIRAEVQDMKNGRQVSTTPLGGNNAAPQGREREVAGGQTDSTTGAPPDDDERGDGDNSTLREGGQRRRSGEARRRSGSSGGGTVNPTWNTHDAFPSKWEGAVSTTRSGTASQTAQPTRQTDTTGQTQRSSGSRGSDSLKENTIEIEEAAEFTSEAVSKGVSTTRSGTISQTARPNRQTDTTAPRNSGSSGSSGKKDNTIEIEEAAEFTSGDLKKVSTTRSPTISQTAQPIRQRDGTNRTGGLLASASSEGEVVTPVLSEEQTKEAADKFRQSGRAVPTITPVLSEDQTKEAVNTFREAENRSRTGGDDNADGGDPQLRAAASRRRRSGELRRRSTSGGGGETASFGFAEITRGRVASTTQPGTAGQAASPDKSLQGSGSGNQTGPPVGDAASSALQNRSSAGVAGQDCEEVDAKSDGRRRRSRRGYKEKSGCVTVNVYSSGSEMVASTTQPGASQAAAQIRGEAGRSGNDDQTGSTQMNGTRGKGIITPVLSEEQSKEATQKSLRFKVENQTQEARGRNFSNATDEEGEADLKSSRRHRRRRSGIVTINIYSSGSDGDSVVSTTKPGTVQTAQESKGRAGGPTKPHAQWGKPSGTARLPAPSELPSEEAKEDIVKSLKACKDAACRAEARSSFATRGNRSGKVLEAFVKQAEASAAKEVAEEALTSCFSAQLSIKEQAECFKKSKAEMHESTDAFMEDLPAEVKERKKEELAKEAARGGLCGSFSSCLAKGGNRSGCMQELADSKAAFGLKGEDASAITLRHFGSTLAEASSNCTDRSCRKASKEAAVAAGMLEREYAKVKELGEVKTAAELYASCKRAGGDDNTCLGLARDEYLRVSGSSANEFGDELLVRVQNLGEAIETGTPTVVVRLKRMAVTVSLTTSAIGAELLEWLVATLDSKTSVAERIMGLKVYPCVVTTRLTTWSWVSLRCDVDSNTTDTMINQLSDHVVTTFAAGRRLATEAREARVGEVYAAQDAAECSQSDASCLAGEPSAEPTPSPPASSSGSATPQPPAESAAAPSPGTSSRAYAAPASVTPSTTPPVAAQPSTSSKATESFDEPISTAATRGFGTVMVLLASAMLWN